jgi:AcrR family transcriptional regulator
MARRTKLKPPRANLKRGRRPGRESSRSAILDAARSRFARQGYEATTIRAIAGDAGVDPSLVMQFYGTKDGLFEAVIQEMSAITERMLATMVGPGADLGARVARAYLQLWEDPVTGDAVRSLVRAAVGSQRASSVLRNYFIGKLRRTDVPEEKRLGLTLAASHLLGTAVGRYLVGAPDLAAAPLDELVHRIAPAIERYLNSTE